MEKKKPITGNFRALLFMPSFYGLITFTVSYLLYIGNIFQFEERNLKAQLIFLSTISFFLASIIFNFSNYKWLLNNDLSWKRNVIRKLDGFTYFIIILFFIIGILGSVKYILDFSGYFGGVWLFFFLLLNDSAQIRIAAEMQGSIGFQLTYFAWIAASLFILDVRLKNLNRGFIFLAILAFSLNLLFIDRTRPLTIMLTTMLVLFFMFYDRFSTRFLWRMLIISVISFVSIFVIIGEWVGKVATEGEYGKTIVPPMFQTVALYASTPFGYFNRIVAEETRFEYYPSRSLYPAQKILSSLKLAEEPPPQINEFYFIPQPVNVGTFLEPLYRDGGLLYCFLGIILHSFVFDFLGLFFIKYPNRFGLYGLATLCLIDFYAFFTPKFHNLPMWIFMTIAIFATWVTMYRFKNNSSKTKLT